MKNEKDDANYFSLDNLNELCGVDEHLHYAEGLIVTYGGDVQQMNEKNQWDQFRNLLDQIRRKKNDKKLNISVIGEFSTGKSTFINALLRAELLASSALQGTTVASTVIEYGTRYKVEEEYLDGRPLVNTGFSNLDTMKRYLDRLTTDPSTARQLSSVHATIPAELLKKSIRIIDTPGTNVTEAWHEDVTIRTLNEISDLSIVLISAEKPAAETTLAFVRQNLESVLPQCVYVVTKLDKIRPRERKRQLDYIKMRLEDQLELENAVVLPYISPMVLAENMNQEITSEGDAVDSDLVRQSIQTEELLFQHAAKQRAIAQTKKLTRLIDNMYQILSLQMQRISDGYKQKLDLLNRTQRANLKSFVEKEKTERLKQFRSGMKEVEDDAEEKIRSAAAKARLDIFGILDEKKTIDDLKKYISGNLGNDCGKGAENIVRIAEDYYQPIQSGLKKEMRHFNKAFQKLYKEMNLLPLDMSRSDYNLPGKISVETADLSTTAAYIAEELSKENWAMGGGAAAGAVIGTAIMPGVGTVVGGIIGLFAGGVVAPETGKVRDNCKSKLETPLKSYYNSVSDKSTTAVERYISKMETCLVDEIDKYLKTYQDKVNQMLQKEEQQRSAIQGKISRIQTDLDQIQSRKRQLSSVSIQLDMLGRKE